jgi:hypothetical protein
LKTTNRQSTIKKSGSTIVLKVIINRSNSSNGSNGDSGGLIFLQRQPASNPLFFSSFSQSTSFLFPKKSSISINLEKEGLSSFG